MFKTISEVDGNSILIRSWNSFGKFYETEASNPNSDLCDQVFWNKATLNIPNLEVWMLRNDGRT